MEFKDWYSLDESAELIAQSLLPESEDEDLKNILERGLVKTQHKQTLINKAKAGKVSLHTSYLVQIPANEILFHLKHNAGLLKKNLEKYADDIGIKLFAATKPEVLIPTKPPKKRGRPPSLTDEKIAELIQMKIDKPTLLHKSLADEFKISRTQVGKLLRNNDIN